MGLGVIGAKEKNNAPEISGFDELAVQDGRFHTTLIRPDADFSQYEGLLPMSVELEFRESKSSQSVASTGSHFAKKNSSTRKPKAKDIAKFKRAIGDACISELERRERFEVAGEAGPNTLFLRTRVTDMVSYLALKKSRNDDPSVQLVATGTIVFDLIDAETGVIQARVAERRRIMHFVESPEDGTKTALWADVEQWAQLAASDLLDEIERVQTETTVGAEAETRAHLD